jgi:hypothetical protein
MREYRAETDPRGGKTIYGPDGFVWIIPEEYPDGAAEDIARNMTDACAHCECMNARSEDLRIRERP